MNKKMKYTSKNGYTGVMYGNSSLVILDRNGKEVFHTGFRNCNTYFVISVIMLCDATGELMGWLYVPEVKFLEVLKGFM